MPDVLIAIRDDDINYFTDPHDILTVYQDISYFPLSLGVIPYVTDVRGGCTDTFNNIEPRPIGLNDKLIDFLKKGIETGNCEIVMHGITHQYQTGEKGLISEMIWRDYDELQKEVHQAKIYLENLLGTKIRCFAAPSNQIDKKGISVILNEGMDFSGIIRHFDRNINIHYLINYFKRWWARLFYKIPFPGILDYHTHIEINACEAFSYDYLMRIYKYCKRYGYPMVINTHYWQLRDSPQARDEVINFIKFAVADGAIPSTISQCIDAYTKRRSSNSCAKP